MWTRPTCVLSRISNYRVLSDCIEYRLVLLVVVRVYTLHSDLVNGN
jgi:hypothetical protein